MNVLFESLDKANMSVKQNTIPSFPYGSKEPKPLPPKYLEITDADGKTKTIENPKRIEVETARYGGGAKAAKPQEVNSLAPKQLNIIQKGGKAPFVKTMLAQTEPLKSYDSAPHRFRAAVDSTSDAKGVVGNSQKLQQQLLSADYSYIQQTQGPRYHGRGMTGYGGAALAQSQDRDYDHDDEALQSDTQSLGMNSAESRLNNKLPKEFGTHYLNVPNAQVRMQNAIPKQATLPRPYIPHAKHFFDSQAKLANRTASGEILGSYKKNYVDPANVMYTEPGFVPTPVTASVTDDFPVGPDNPVKPYDAAGIWSACWDAEAEAVYYYNNENGEATWIPPPI